MTTQFRRPLSDLNRVGQKISTKLKKLDLENTLDLIFYFPVRYEDFSQVTNIENLEADLETTIKGKIELINNRRSWKRRMMLTEVVVADVTESIKIIWFNQPYIAKVLKAGDEIFISGKVTEDQFGLHFKNPVYEKVKADTAHTARIVPIYSLTEGVTQKQLRFIISQIVKEVDKLSEWLPAKIIKKYKLISLSEALEQIHFPESFSKLNEAKKRLGFDELFTVQLYNLQAKAELEKTKAFKIKFKEKQIKEFVSSLPFTLTAAQKKCAWQIIKDLEESKPMNRLLEGDVGSGKTVVAALAMYNVALNSQQAVLMAPTEILAQQHFETLEKVLGPDTVSLITRTKKKILDDQKIIVGTHALIQKKVEFKNLGLAIIDEQHRFGVEQRKTLQEKSGDKKTVPHLLSMTATPIPRTLALTIYGDLDLSIIDEMPKGRKKIITRLVEEKKRDKAYGFIKEKIKNQEQVFVICPLISESDKLGVKSVEEEYERLKKIIFPDLRIAKLHGKLKAKAKDEIMNDFKNKKYDILVATSVVEVGVDVPDATIMMIEGADRFGLAQLHQFRGRVGRSDKQSYCLLFTDSKSDKTLERLNALCKSTDGFRMAEYDLKLRGPGDVYGKEQSGFLSAFRIASLADHVLISEAKQAATDIRPEIDKYPLILAKLDKFSHTIHLE